MVKCSLPSYFCLVSWNTVKYFHRMTGEMHICIFTKFTHHFKVYTSHINVCRAPLPLKYQANFNTIQEGIMYLTFASRNRSVKKKCDEIVMRLDVTEERRWSNVRIRFMATQNTTSLNLLQGCCAFGHTKFQITEIQSYSKRRKHFQKFILQVLLNMWRCAIYRLKGELWKLFLHLTSTRCEPHVWRGRCQIDNPALPTLVTERHR
jgi:hypothetical protein